MTDTQKTKDCTPVTCAENREVKGAALCAKIIHDQNQSKTQALRERHAAYHANLPKDEKAAFHDILKNLCEPRDVGEEEYAVRAALTIVHRLATHALLDDDENLNDAVYWLTTKGLDALDVIERGNKRSRDIADHFVHPERAYEA